MLKNFELKKFFNQFMELLLPKDKKNLTYFLSLFYLLNVSLVIVFGRPFVGIFIFNQQLGKYYVFAGAITLVFLFLGYYFFSLKIDKIYRNLIIISTLIVLTFFISLITNGFISDMYIFKSSSYIWSLGYFVLGFYFLNNIKREIVLLILFLSTFALYFVSIINYPNFIIDIFISSSDKFQLVKAADSLLIFVLLNIVFSNFSKFSEKFKVQMLFYSFGMFLPYYIYQSRGSLLAATLFFTLSIFSYKKFIRKNIIKVFLYTLLSIILFYVSSYSITFISVDEEFLPDNFTEVTNTIIDEVLTEKETREGFLTFYIQDGRLFSRDTTTNWRLDIWQDLVEDLNSKNKMALGFGYTELFEIMGDPSQPGRLGRDGLNEHVHNYFFNILGRGGIIQLIFFVLFYFYVFKIWKEKSINTFDFFKLFIPIMIVSGLDVTMEGVHFPLVFFSFLGYILSND